ncbi:MAG: ClpX C4-type zinc finger protein [Proteobacteria bacterium]|nr:ClpX C4-type zinc finger protein [Pseudomonadota bacterium]
MLGVDDPPASSASCSFCGRSASEAELGAGPNAYICADCVGIFHQVLGPKRSAT